MTKTAQNLTTAVAFAGLAMYGLWSLEAIPARATAFPRLVFVVMMGLSLILLALTLLEILRRPAPASEPPAEGALGPARAEVEALPREPVGADRERPLKSAPSGQLGRWITSTAAFLAYVLSFTHLGFYTATFLLTLLLPLGIGYRRPWRALGLAVGFTGSLYVIFTMLLRRPLPPELPAVLLGFS